MADKKEFIICSAINYNSTIICGKRHKHCIMTAEDLLEEKYDESIGSDRANQGFLTSFNRYVDRKEAFRIALDNDQIRHKLYDINNPDQELVSEDLY